MESNALESLSAATTSPTVAPGGGIAAQAEQQITTIAALLTNIEPVPGAESSIGAEKPAAGEHALVQARLGVAGGLYAALKWKHEPTARHCLRVAMACSAWIHRIGLPAGRCDDVEVAALLHDVGKIGVPDRILTKPGPLTPQETAVIDNHWLMGGEILRDCGAAKPVQDILLSASAWFDGSKKNCPGIGESIPLGARILAIVDAFDSMTADSEYRRAITREQAFAELEKWAGRQFDPRLVKSFRELHDHDETRLWEQVPRRWLQQLDPTAVNMSWLPTAREVANNPSENESLPLFRAQLLDHTEAAVFFLDSSLHVIGWNPSAERLTGLPEHNVRQRAWAPSLLRLRDEQGRLIPDEQCPLANALGRGTAWTGRWQMRSAAGHVATVQAQAVPVNDLEGKCAGLAVEMRDVSPEASAAQHRQALDELATRDDVTQLANRAAFDRSFEEFVACQPANKRPASLIIADIDRFQQINEEFGHHAGDEILRCLAALIKGSCRKGDLVARFSGQEFAILYVDCDAATVEHRADQLRGALARLPQSVLGGKTATISVGMTEIQPGDAAETMLRRAGRALLSAKEGGGNRVVQLGTGQESADRPIRKVRCKFTAGQSILERQFASQVPLAVSVEKLRGFIVDHHADVLELHPARIVLALRHGPGGRSFLSGDARPCRFTMEIEMREERSGADGGRGLPNEAFVRTLIKVVIRPEKTWERRQRVIDDRAQQLLVSLRAYLMAVDAVEPDVGVLQRAKSLFTPWWTQK